VFENRVLRRIFEPKRERVTGGLRQLHIEEPYNLCYSPNIMVIKKDEIVGAFNKHWERRDSFKIFARKPEGK
jgi:hypothetical protein